MMNDEKKMIQDALQSGNPQKETEKVCRQLLRQRIRNSPFSDRDLRFIVEEIVDRLDFSIDFEMVSKHKPIKDNLVRLKLTYGALGVLGLCTAFVDSDSTLLRIVGFAMTIFSGFGMGKIYKNQRITNTAQLTEFVVKSTADEILKKVNAIYKRLSALLVHNQLEGRYKDVLGWLQYQYSYNNDSKFKEKLTELFNSLGYEFVEYDSSLSEHFDERKANVAERITTILAVRNIETQEYVLNGVVVFPMEK